MENTNLVPEMQEENLSEQMQVRRGKLKALQDKGQDPFVKTKYEVTDYAKETLYDIPYHLSAGFIGEKAPDTTKPYFGMQCAYLVWYAWNHFGYDLDSDGGRLVTSADLLHSDVTYLAPHFVAGLHYNSAFFKYSLAFTWSTDNSVINCSIISSSLA